MKKRRKTAGPDKKEPPRRAVGEFAVVYMILGVSVLMQYAAGMPVLFYSCELFLFCGMGIFAVLWCGAKGLLTKPAYSAVGVNILLSAACSVTVCVWSLLFYRFTVRQLLKTALPGALFLFSLLELNRIYWTYRLGKHK